MPEFTANLVIGAGISGLLFARRLHDAGHQVTVLEKGRGFGGRMATRRIGNARLDHGAQYFTVRTPEFQSVLDGLLENGAAREWFRKLPQDTAPDGHPRYIGVNGMSDIAKSVAAGLDVRRECRVVELRYEHAGWTVKTEAGTLISARRLILTAPVPQALELLETSGVALPEEILQSLHAIRYERGLAVMALLDGPSGLEGFGGLKPPDAEPLTWLADNQMKGISPQVPAVTLHASARFAEEHWDSPDELRGPLLIAAAQPYLKCSILEYHCHRWGYTLPITSFGQPFLHLPELGLLLAGDGFGGPRIEGAATSGLAAAAWLLRDVNQLPG